MESVSALSRAASGLEAGIVGGVAMFVVLVVFSLLRGRVWWETPNLLGSTFYGSRAFRSGVSMATLSGTAFHLVITGTLGTLFGLACGALARQRLVLLGIVAGVFWYYFADAVLWRQINPLVPLYTFAPGAIVSHGVFGACLGYMGQRSRYADVNAEVSGVFESHPTAPRGDELN
jgi:hypothetical protein